MPELAPATRRELGEETAAGGGGDLTDHPREQRSGLDDAHRYLSHKRDEFFDVTEGSPAQFAERLRAFADDPPKSYWPKQKLERLVETVERSGVDGMVIFSEGHMQKYGLGDTARSLFT